MVGLLYRENRGKYHISILNLVPASFRFDLYRGLLSGVPGIPRRSVDGAPPYRTCRAADGARVEDDRVESKIWERTTLIKQGVPVG